MGILFSVHPIANMKLFDPGRYVRARSSGIFPLIVNDCINFGSGFEGDNLQDRIVPSELPVTIKYELSGSGRVARAETDCVWPDKVEYEIHFIEKKSFDQSLMVASRAAGLELD